MAYSGLVSNSGKLRGFLADSDVIKDSANALTFKVVCTTPQGVELPLLIEPRGMMTADADEDVAVARKALTRIVEREVAILRKVHALHASMPPCPFGPRLPPDGNIPVLLVTPSPSLSDG